MLIAEQLQNKNRIEYLLYMWQLEDIFRAYGCDFMRLEQEYLNQFTFTSEEQASKVKQWYANLLTMMHQENILEKGHLQLSKNIVSTLNDLHLQLSSSTKYPFYQSAYLKVLPYLVELKQKQKGEAEESEVEQLLNILYGVMLLRLQKKEVNPETEEAVKNIALCLGLLSDYYFEDKKKPLLF